MNYIDDIKKFFKGDIKADKKTRELYSHDTSLFEVVPEVILFPRTRDDIKQLVTYVANHKKTYPNLSITARSGGSDMSGGAINDSIIIDFERYFKNVGEVRENRIITEPGVWYRDFEKKTMQHNKIFPSYPASRDLAAMGGIINNNAGGEKSLAYGKTERFVKRIKAVLNDGNEYEFGPIPYDELKKKMAQKNFEGNLYREIFNIVEKKYDLIKQAKPTVTKNSTGYNVWNVWDRDKQIFDMSALFVGGQGTLGLMTEAEVELVDHKPFSGMLVGYVHSLDNLGELIREIVIHRPSSFETFDDHTVRFAIRFFWQFHRTLGWLGLIKLGLGLIPDAILLIRSRPKLILLVEYEGDSEEEVVRKIRKLRSALERQNLGILLENAETEAKSRRFWIMRRESFNLLRKNVKGNVHTAPYIDDLVVPPQHLPEFLPKFREILERYKLLYTIAGHMGDGNFHVIPLMDFSNKMEVDKIEPSLKEVNALVLKYGGSISGEHNDGLIRGPFLEDMYGKNMMNVFRDIKHVFDPQNIFNPHKKTDANWAYSRAHMREHF